MPDGNASALDVEDDIDFTIHVACECYCDLELVQDAMARQPHFNEAIALAAPRVPDPASLSEDADLVLIVADMASLAPAMARAAAYRRIKQATLLIYLQDSEQPSPEIPGLAILRSELLAGVTRLVQALITPVIPQGLICVDWADTRHILDLDGRALVEEAFGSQPEDLMRRVLDRLRERAMGSPISGMQMSISCSSGTLKTRLVHALVSACREAMPEDGTLIAAAPFLDWPESDRVEIRIFAKVGSGAQ